MSISVLILTLNEEINMHRCLTSLKWCDDIVVLDSHSNDKTIDIAKAMSARVVKRRFDNYASQRNFGLKEIDYKNSWVLMVDADEAVTPELAIEMQHVIGQAASDLCIFRMRRKDYFMGKWIRHSSGYPTWFGRLMRIGKVRIEREINEEYLTDNKVGLLQEHLIHYPFNKGFYSWFEKHNRYSSMEGVLLEANQSYKMPFNALFSNDPVRRRKAQKSIGYRIPCRPLFIFLALYVVRGGFLDGGAGFIFCLLRSFYEFMINCKALEARRRKRNLPV